MLLESEAKARSQTVSEVNYDLVFLLNGEKPFFRGIFKVSFKLADGFNNENLFIDF